MGDCCEIYLIKTLGLYQQKENTKNGPLAFKQGHVVLMEANIGTERLLAMKVHESHHCNDSLQV